MLTGQAKVDAPTITQDVKGSGASRTERVDESAQPTAKPNVLTPPMKGNTPPPTPAMRDLMLKLNSMEQSQRDYEKKILQASRTMTDMQSKLDAQAKVIDEHHASADKAISALETYTDRVSSTVDSVRTKHDKRDASTPGTLDVAALDRELEKAYTVDVSTKED